jgi:hypothetical protein
LAVNVQLSQGLPAAKAGGCSILSSYCSTKEDVLMGTIREWARATEEALWKSSELGDLFSHKGLVGEMREQRLIEVLSDFLPATVTVGSGQILDANGEHSSQMDIVIAKSDSFKLPLSQAGSSAYLVETVVGVIEVKSWLDKSSLANALQTLNSINSLGFMVNLPDIRDPERIGKRDYLTEEEVEQLSSLPLYPSTYLYVYDSRYAEVVETFPETLLSVARAVEITPKGWPSVIACKGVVGLKNDGFLLPPDGFGMPWAFAYREENHPLYWILAHLLHRILAITGGPNLEFLSARFLVENHLDPIPSDGWNLLGYNY